MSLLILTDIKTPDQCLPAMSFMKNALHRLYFLVQDLSGQQTRVSGLFRRRGIKYRTYRTQASDFILSIINESSTKYVQLRSRNKNRQLVQNVLMYYLLRYFKSSTKFNRLGYITEPLFSGISTAVVSFSWPEPLFCGLLTAVFHYADYTMTSLDYITELLFCGILTAVVSFSCLEPLFCGL